MKYILHILFLLMSVSSGILAQMVPQGMRYQAVARDASGQVIEDQKIALKIILKAGDKGDALYTELHQVSTNKLGLFSITVGEGRAIQGTFTDIPWSVANVWLDIEMDAAGGKNFIAINSTQLLAVPYAFHAGTAGSVSGDNQETTKNGLQLYWSTTGNLNTIPGTHFLGSRDYKDLVFKTNNIERLVITKDGDIDIDGSLAVGVDLLVGNDALIEHDLTVGNDFEVNGLSNFENTTESTTKDNGAVVIEGGIGIEKNMNVGGNTTVGGNSAVTGNLTVTGNSTVTANSIVNGTTGLNGQVTISANVSGGEGSYGAYPLRVEGSEQGIAIKLNPTNPVETNNFVTFFGSGTDNSVGRIEGQTGISGIIRQIAIDIVGDIDEADAFAESDDKYQAPEEDPTFENYIGSNYAFDAINQTVDFVFTIGQFGINLAGASGLCVSGDCDDVIWSAIDMIKTGLQLAALIIMNELNIGITYESGGADYAEWMCRQDSAEHIGYGEIVGVNGGLISKSFETAERFMVNSSKPGVLGAMPDRDKEHLYNKIAFMGQVPVKVHGKVEIGDYILPSGNGDGTGIAVHPDHMAISDFSRIVGVAWSKSEPNMLYNYINTAVGMHHNQLSGVVSQMQSVMNAMQAALEKLSPDFKATYFDGLPGKPSQMEYTTLTRHSSELLIEQKLLSHQYTTVHEAMQDVKLYAQEVGFDYNNYPYLAQLLDDPSPENARIVNEYYGKAMNRGNKMLEKMMQYRKN